jgi:CHASE1-domain containing sensor protein
METMDFYPGGRVSAGCSDKKLSIKYEIQLFGQVWKCEFNRAEHFTQALDTR